MDLDIYNAHAKRGSKMTTPKKLTCFVIGPIGDTGSETRKRSDKVLKHVFEAALSEEYKITRADKISAPGMITSQILQALQDSDLVIADLTEHNPNVFYELAVRHAVEKPVIHVSDPAWKMPFDVAGFRTIVFDYTDLDDVAIAIEELQTQASETRAGNWGETPIKLANVMRPSKGDSADTLLLKQAVEGITNVAAKISQIEININRFSATQSLNTSRTEAGGGALAYLLSTRYPNSAELNQTWSDSKWQHFLEDFVDARSDSEKDKEKRKKVKS